MTTMTRLPTPETAIVDARRAALAALDPIVREELALAACRWALDPGYTIDLTAYRHVYRRLPNTGGHWLLYSAEETERGQTLATLSVSLEFAGDAAKAFHVSGARGQRAAGCTAGALREALAGRGGPLRQSMLAPALLVTEAVGGMVAASSEAPR